MPQSQFTTSHDHSCARAGQLSASSTTSPLTSYLLKESRLGRVAWSGSTWFGLLVFEWMCVCVDSPVVATSLPMEMLPKESYRKAHELVDYVNKEISNLMTLYHYLHVQKIDL